MKRILLSAIAAAAVGAAGAAHAAPQTLKLTVNGMVCAFCAQGIEKRLTALPQTQAVYVNLPKKMVAVEAKDGQTIDVQRVRAEVKDAGYDITNVETVGQSVADIKAQAKGRK